MKLLYITSLSGKRINGFMKSAIVAAKELGIEFTMACNTDMADKEGYKEDCKNYGINMVHIDFDRNPLGMKNRTAYKQLLDLMKKERFDIVHCNTPIGGLLGRICAKRIKVPYIIYMAHGFHFWKGAPLKNWLLYYPVEWLLSFWTDLLITINKEDYKIARDKFRAKRTEYVHGVGVDAKRMTLTDGVKEQINRQIREELETPYDAQVYLSVGEVNENKNHMTVIKALAYLNDANSYYWIAGDGENRQNLMQLVKELGLEDKVRFLGYRGDVENILNTADVFIFPSKREGLGIALAEGILVGLPCISTNIRGPVDLMPESKYLFEPENVEQLASLMKMIVTDTEIENEVIRNQINLQPYLFDEVVKEFLQIYRELI